MERKIRFRSFDGTSLEGTYRSALSTPRGEVAVLVHGITSSRDELGLFSGLAGHLATEGMPSVRFDYRCHGASKDPIETMTLSGVVNDIEAAATAGLQEAGASAAHVIGMSFGGGLAAFWAASTKVSVASVVLFAPVIDYEEDVLGQHGAISDGGLNEKLGRRLRSDGFVEMDGVRYGRALLNEVRFISGTAGLERLGCESIIVHGDADSVVPYRSSEQAVRLNKRCRLINIPGTDHGFGVPDDEDLSSPETKQKHQEVFRIVSRFLAQLAQ